MAKKAPIVPQKSAADKKEENKKSPAFYSFSGKTGNLLFVPPGAAKGSSILVQPATADTAGALMVLDFLRYWHGPLFFKPQFDASQMVLRHIAVTPGDNHGIAIELTVRGFGTAVLSATSRGVRDAIEAAWNMFLFSPQSRQNMVPIYELMPPRSYEHPAHGSTIFNPVILHRGWVARTDLFMPALVKLPETGGAVGVATDALFGDFDHDGVVLPAIASPAPRAPPASTPRGGRKTTNVPLPKEQRSGPDPDLDDAVPF
jgi:hypothetical protein